MCSKIKQPAPDPENINRQIVEIKKKIQLSEGQRKALFEICEAERKFNADEILKLKKEISRLALSLHENRSTAAKHRIQIAQLESVVGPIVHKTCDQVKQLLDLQIIDKSKQLNLLQYQKKKRQKHLISLAKEYERLLSGRDQKVITEKVETPLKQTCQDLQNNIHAIEVQYREADHVQIRYKDIKKSLLEDAARFESKIQQVKEDLKNQQNDINRLQEITEEACKLRGIARNVLIKEERYALSSASTRDKQAENGQRLVMEKKQDLERLERRIFQGGKSSRPEPEAVEENTELEAENAQTIEFLREVFETLKVATGGISVSEVLEKFKAQKETSKRLSLLRSKGEAEKHMMEKEMERITLELESHKYAEAKDKELNVEEVESINQSLEDEEKKMNEHIEQSKELEIKIKKFVSELTLILLEIHPIASRELDSLEIIAKLRKILSCAMKQLNFDEEGEDEFALFEANEDKWLPPPYSGLVRRTPVPQQGQSPVPQQTSSSDDDEDVPSRGYLKRQAQLVVDAKSRRKNMRLQLPRLK